MDYDDIDYEYVLEQHNEVVKEKYQSDKANIDSFREYTNEHANLYDETLEISRFETISGATELIDLRKEKDSSIKQNEYPRLRGLKSSEVFIYTENEAASELMAAISAKRKKMYRKFSADIGRPREMSEAVQTELTAELTNAKSAQHHNEIISRDLNSVVIPPKNNGGEIFIRINESFKISEGATYNLLDKTVCEITSKGVLIVLKCHSLAKAIVTGSISRSTAKDATANSWGYGAVAEACEKGAVAEACEKGAVAKAMVKGSVAFAIENGTVAEAHEDGTVAISRVSGSISKAFSKGSIAVAIEDGAVAEAYGDGTVATEWFEGSKTQKQKRMEMEQT